MTRETAINKLNWALDNNTIEDVQSAYEYIIALKMAIEALEQESCDDTITDIIEYINERGGRNLFKDDSEYDCIIDYIEALPPVQPVGRWIPVSERLPEKGGDYLVTTEWKGSYSGDVYIETNMAVYREKEKEWDCAGIVAWMPLPEPYEANN